MNSLFDKKLDLMIRFKEKNDMIVGNKNETSKFLKELNDGKISHKLVTYLYNYLYKFGAGNSISIVYSGEKINLFELMDKTIKYSIIELDSTFGDIKRTSITIGNNKMKKHIHYSLDSNIDFVNIETSEKEYNSEDVNEMILNEILDEDYHSISVINIAEPLMYETTIIDGKVDSYSSIMYKDEMIKSHNMKYDISEIKENTTDYTKNAYKELEVAYRYSKNRNFDGKELIKRYNNK